LHNKRIIEVGGGKVDFLSLLIDLGNNYGLRLDPFRKKIEDKSLADANDIDGSIPSSDLKLYENHKADFVFSYHELEHANSPKRFLSVLRQIVGLNPNTPVFFAVPNALKAFKEGDYTDIIYEHVSYFTVPSLSYLFSSCGFCISEVTESKNEIFDSLYISALPENRMKTRYIPSSKLEIKKIEEIIKSFATKSNHTIETYSQRIKELLNKGQRVVMWGAGARGVTFLNILKDPRIKYAVDINPRKQGMYVPGTGQKIVEPKFLFDHRPDYIILANPAYENEIRQITSNLGIQTEFILI
jgi:hypothetical protein